MDDDKADDRDNTNTVMTLVHYLSPSHYSFLVENLQYSYSEQEKQANLLSSRHGQGTYNGKRQEDHKEVPSDVED